ncbi:MAG: urease subunit alpha [Anaerovoracaceae bacterium]|nr:urease subunit alpha [Anaerovoracaceae bacterium]
MAVKLSRQEYCDMFGPTVGDKIHLADTGLIAEIEKDYAADCYGDEILFGGGKTDRDGMGNMAGKTTEDGVLDVCVTNAVIIDPMIGIVKGDIGIKDGVVVGVGKAGNPDTMNITPGLIIGCATEVVSAEGLVITPGGIDVHVHFESPAQAWEAMSNGLTTMLGGGSGAKTTSVETPGPEHLLMMIEAHEELPVNAGFLGRGNSALPEAIVEQALNGAIGMKIHEDFGATPQVIRSCLEVADEMGFQVQIHTDTLNEGGFVETTIGAFEGRTIHTYHSEGAGGGHAPDIMKVVGEPNVIPSSTNCTNPYTVNTIAEHLDMIMAVHHLNPKVPEDVAFADSRVRGETIAAEDVLHDMGAISIHGSDSQGMGRVGETILRTWQMASKMKKQRGPLPEETGDNDNERILRYMAKYTINAAKVFGIDDYVGSLLPGRLADFCVWDPAFFGAKPWLVFKCGQVAYSSSGDVNAAIEVAQPMLYRKQYSACGSALNRYSKIFVTQQAIDAGLGDKVPNSKHKLLPIKNTRNLTKADMVRNDYLPNIEIDPETYKVYVDGEHITCEPEEVVCLNHKYYFR